MNTSAVYEQVNKRSKKQQSEARSNGSGVGL